MNKPYKRKLLEELTQKIQTDKVTAAEAILLVFKEPDKKARSLNFVLTRWFFLFRAARTRGKPFFGGKKILGIRVSIKACYPLIVFVRGPKCLI